MDTKAKALGFGAALIGTWALLRRSSDKGISIQKVLTRPMWATGKEYTHPDGTEMIYLGGSKVYPEMTPAVYFYCLIWNGTEHLVSLALTPKLPGSEVTGVTSVTVGPHWWTWALFASRDVGLVQGERFFSLEAKSEEVNLSVTKKFQVLPGSFQVDVEA